VTAALINGASTGIGREFARLFAADGGDALGVDTLRNVGSVAAYHPARPGGGLCRDAGGTGQRHTGVGTKRIRAMSATSPSRRFTGDLSGRFVTRH
jgi:NAD(P)-dependent dehydrogenase (short-subunit alcohol dehydrogenase family)